ncbi:MAG: HD domain-containing phosphohydrolase [Geminicoccaceae bacterium]
MASSMSNLRTRSDDLLNAELTPPKDAPPLSWRSLVLAVACVAVLVTVLGAVIAETLVASRRDSALAAEQQRLEAVADAKAALIGTWLEGRAALGQRLARADLVRMFLQEKALAVPSADLADSLDAQAPYIRQALADFTFDYGARAAVLEAADGTPLLRVSRGETLPPLAPLRPDQTARLASQGWLAVVTEPTEPDGTPVARLYLPVLPLQSTSDDPETAIGRFGFQIPLDQPFSELLARDPSAPPAQHTRVYAPGRALVWRGERAVRIDNAFMQAEAAVDESDLVVGVYRPQAEVVAPAHAFSQQLRLLVAMSALSAGLLVASIWGWARLYFGGKLLEQFRSFSALVAQHRALLVHVCASMGEALAVWNTRGDLVLANQAARQILLPNGRLPGPLARQCETVGGTCHPTSSVACEETVLPDGRVVQLSLTPLREAAHTAPLGGIVLMRDVSDSVAMRAALARQKQQVIAAFVRMSEMADPYLAGHAQRMSDLGRQIAHKLALDEQRQRTIGDAALLSQVGKLFLPADLVQSAGRHDTDEQMQMRAHIDHAARVLAGIDFDLPIKETVRDMHERLDGSGYPEGKAGDEIGIEARILAVADVICARTAPRSYREAMDVARVLDILRDLRERYDQRVVEAARRCLVPFDAPTSSQRATQRNKRMSGLSIEP